MPRPRIPKVRVKVSLEGQLSTRNGARLNYTLNVAPKLTIGHIVAMIRKQVKLNEFEAIFAFVGDRLVPMSAILSGLARCNMLEISLSSENAFGSKALPYKPWQ